MEIFTRDITYIICMHYLPLTQNIRQTELIPRRVSVDTVTEKDAPRAHTQDQESLQSKVCLEGRVLQQTRKACGIVKKVGAFTILLYLIIA